MNTVIRLTARWWKPLLFAAWVWALAGLLKNGQYAMYLRPEFAYVIGLGVFTLLGFMVTAMTENRPTRFEIVHGLHALILVLPLAYLLNAQGVSLDSYAFENRALGLPTVSSTGSDDLPPVMDHPALVPPAGAVSEKLVTLTSLYSAPDFYRGKEVELVGMLRKNDAHVEKEFGKGALLVFRFVVNCCAADATPLSVLIEPTEEVSIPDNAWVQVQGQFEIMKKGRARVPMLKKATLRAAKRPGMPYLFQ